jgi:hypothetical protein
MLTTGGVIHFSRWDIVVREIAEQLSEFTVARCLLRVYRVDRDRPFTLRVDVELSGCCHGVALLHGRSAPN